MSGWIGVDLDGTLAQYAGWKGHDHIGDPVPAMVERVLKWVREGKEVRIFTARVADRNPRVLELGQCEVTNAIKEWCIKHLGFELPITNIKDFGMIELWDDRVVQVEMNTGRPVGHSTRDLGD